MAVTLLARAGTSLKTHVRYWTPDKTELIPAVGYTARLQLRAARPPGRVIMNVNETDDPNAPLSRVEDGHWRVNLSGAVTRMLPPSTRFEVELVNDLAPDDVVTLVSGVINTNPQAVSNG